MVGTRTETISLSQREIAFRRIVLGRRKLLPFTKFTHEGYQTNWHHKLVADALDDWVEGKTKRLMLFMPPRHGKCITNNTPVLTWLGWITHGKIKIGDFVFSPSGKQIKVLEISEEYECNVEIELISGDVIKCHSNHEWTFYDRSYKKWRTEETNFFIKNNFGKKRIIFSGGRCIYQLPNIKQLYFKNQKLLVDPYFLGIWLGDGRASEQTLTLCPDDADYILNGISYNKTFFSVHKDTKVPTVGFGYQNIKKYLRKIGVLNNKHIPEIYLRSSIEQRLNLLAGLIDSDGHVDKKGRVRFVNTNKKLIDGVFDLCSTLGFRPYITQQEPHNSTTLPIKSDKICYTVGFQPTIKIPTKVPRKKITKLITQRRVGIKSVKVVNNKKKGKCIQVDSEDGLYLVGKKLIPTHNSELASRKIPAFIFGKYPDADILAASHTASKASDINRDVQRIIDSDCYRQLFPDTQLFGKMVRATSAESYLRNSDIFEIVGHKGRYESAGVGKGIGGSGFRYGIIDDPIKNRKDAESKTLRDGLWHWYTSDFYTRREDENARILLILTRWHEDDLAGRLLEQQRIGGEYADKWKVISFQGIAEEERPEGDPRKIGEALWPVKFSLNDLLSTKSHGSYEFESLYQQRPIPPGGALIKREWFKTILDKPPEGLTWGRFWDLAVSEKETANYTASIAGAMDDKGILYLRDMIRGQWEWPDTHKIIIATSQNEKIKLGVEHAGQQGGFISELFRDPELVDIDFKGYRPDASKKVRALPWIGRAEAGKVVLIRGSWIGEFLSECASFTGHNDKLDDQIDAVSGVNSMFPKKKPQEEIIVPLPVGINRAL